MSHWNNQYQQGPYPPGPPPRSSGSGIWVLCAVVGVVVLGLTATLVVMLAGGDDDEPQNLSASTSVPSQSVPEPAPPAPTESTSPSTSPSESASEDFYDKVLSRQVKTAYGTTFKRLATREASCTRYASTALRKALKKNPCKGQVHSALYVDKTRKIEVMISLLPLGSENDAKTVADRDHVYVNYIPAPKSSGLPRLTGTITTYQGGSAQGKYAVLSSAFRANGRYPGKDVSKAGLQLRTEISGVLIWTN